MYIIYIFVFMNVILNSNIHFLFLSYLQSVQTFLRVYQAFDLPLLFQPYYEVLEVTTYRNLSEIMPEVRIYMYTHIHSVITACC